ncbi:MAG TPA: hypothetical protein VFI03_10980 [Solirubrobacterales bacterium]|nr:hypothetical protein [Solirubrobacterales bacterium]
MRESWTDERLDDLNGRVSDGFRQVDRRFERVEGEIGDLRQEMNNRFDSIQRTITIGAITLSGSFVAGFAAMIALIATQL